jgi:hypothetical protein
MGSAPQLRAPREPLKRSGVVRAEKTVAKPSAWLQDELGKQERACEHAGTDEKMEVRPSVG